MSTHTIVRQAMIREYGATAIPAELIYSTDTVVLDLMCGLYEIESKTLRKDDQVEHCDDTGTTQHCVLPRYNRFRQITSKPYVLVFE